MPAKLRLHILLRAPRLAPDLLDTSTIAVLAGAANRILRIYAELATTGALNPSFCQLRRIVTAAQLVVITALEDEWYGQEAFEILGIAQHLIALHAIIFPQATRLAQVFGSVAITLCEFDITWAPLISSCEKSISLSSSLWPAAIGSIPRQVGHVDGKPDGPEGSARSL